MDKYCAHRHTDGVACTRRPASVGAYCARHRAEHAGAGTYTLVERNAALRTAHHIGAPYADLDTAMAAADDRARGMRGFYSVEVRNGAGTVAYTAHGTE